MYWADTKMASRGLAPHWYGTYRFVLTLVVGMSIVISLIGRGEVEVAKEGSRKDLTLQGKEGSRNLMAKYESEKAKAWEAKKKEEAEEKKKKAAEKEEGEKEDKEGVGEGDEKE
jgi:hypothetical protein